MRQLWLISYTKAQKLKKKTHNKLHWSGLLGENAVIHTRYYTNLELL